MYKIEYFILSFLGILFWLLDKSCYNEIITIQFICDFSIYFHNLAHILFGMMVFFIVFLVLEKVVLNRFSSKFGFLLALFSALVFSLSIDLTNEFVHTVSSAWDLDFMDTIYDVLGTMLSFIIVVYRKG